MQSIKNIEEAIARLENLFQKSGIQDEALSQYIQQLAVENSRLKLSLHKLRTTQASNTNTISSMHSKLTDALRE